MQQLPNKQFDQLIKDTLENASVQPPAFLWNNIEKQLPTNETWYRKYKYLLLLLLLGTFSSTSIAIYKISNHQQKANTIAVTKRLYKDEVNKKNTNKVENSVNNTLAKQQTNTSTLQSQKIDKPNQPSVSGFYKEEENSKDKNAINTAKSYKENAAKKESRLSKFTVKENISTKNVFDNSELSENKSNTIVNSTATQNKSANTNKYTDNTKSTSVKQDLEKSAEHNEIKQNTFANIDNVANDKNINEIVESTNALTPTINNNTIQSLQTATDDNDALADLNRNNNLPNISEKHNASSIATNNDEDLTIPIVEPIKPASTLVASTEPIKIEHTPLSSRTLLRSTIAPEKLEALEMEEMAIGINDLNPNKEKILKNLKQFSGYDINKGFHFGAFININNVWLNKKSFGTDENTQSIKPKVTLGKSYGINIGYDYTDRWGIQLEAQVSEQGQKYNIVQNGIEQNKEINLLYTKFPLMMKYKQVFINNYNSKPIALSFLFGPQFSILLKQKGNIDGVGITNLPQYNKAEFGILSGIDFDLFMTRNVAMTIGARSGFMSSFKKGQPMSFQLGVTTQFNFRFPKKIK